VVQAQMAVAAQAPQPWSQNAMETDRNRRYRSSLCMEDSLRIL
jgi:hypothetical protein